MSRDVCMGHCALVSIGLLSDDVPNGPSPLLPYLLSEQHMLRPLPAGFLGDLVLHCTREDREGGGEGEGDMLREVCVCVCVCVNLWCAHVQVFGGLLEGLRGVVKAASVLDSNCCEAFFALSELCDIRVPSTNTRPICMLVSEHDCHSSL